MISVPIHPACPYPPRLTVHKNHHLTHLYSTIGGKLRRVVDARSSSPDFLAQLERIRRPQQTRDRRQSAQLHGRRLLGARKIR